MTAKMDPEVKTIWVDALRSGEFEQGRGALHRGDKFCCLGVLCVKAIEAGVVVQVADSPTWTGETSYDNHTAALPESVRIWAGMQDRYGSCARGTLTFHNDHGKTFEQIADIIEEHF